jgi:hypothetical protein
MLATVLNYVELIKSNQVIAHYLYYCLLAIICDIIQGSGINENIGFSAQIYYKEFMQLDTIMHKE